MTNESERCGGALKGALGAAAVLVVWWGLGFPRDFEDFRAYSQALAVFLEGGDPYSAILSTVREFRFYSPPYALTVLWPLGLIRPQFAPVLFIVLLTISVAFAVGVFGRRGWELERPSAGVGTGTLTWRARLLHLSILAVLLPVGLIHNILLWGGLSWLPLFGTTLFVWLWSRKNYLLAGLSVIFLLVRIHQEILLLAYIVFLSTRTPGRATLRGIIVVVGIAALFLLGNLSTVARYFEVGAVREIQFSFSTVTIPSLLSQGGFLLPMSCALLLFAGVALRRVFVMTPSEAIPILLPFTLLMGPYAWYHDYLLTLPTSVLFASLVARELTTDRTRGVLLLLIGCAVNILQLLTSWVAMRQALSANFYSIAALASAVPALLSYLYLRGRRCDG